MGIVIYAFPCIGKTYFCNNNLFAVELSSEKYHWLDYIDGEEFKGKMHIVNPSWPKNYLEAILDNLKKYKYVFVTHSGSIICKENNIPYIIIYPNLNMKEKILNRMFLRGNPKELLDNMNNNYEKYIQSMDNDNYAFKKIMLHDNQYLSDVRGDLNE